MQLANVRPSVSTSLTDCAFAGMAIAIDMAIKEGNIGLIMRLLFMTEIIRATSG
jgi:hypothetical protein